MKQALVFALLTSILAGGTCLAQIDKASQDSTAAIRQEMVSAPLRSASAPASFDIKTIYSGAMADTAEFNKKVKVLFMSFGSEPPLENPEGLKKHQEQLIAAGITNSYVYISPGTSHEWQTWRRSLYVFAPLLFR